MNPLLKYGMIAVLIIIAFILLGRFQGSRTTDFNELMQIPGNPLPECPGTQNCVRISLPLAQPTSRIYFLANQTINNLNPVEMTASPDSLKINAVFKIPVFGFHDDLVMQISGEDRNHVLHIRSSSRSGYSDFGVNRRRVQKIVKTIRERL
ncbi:MAG: DUF1499 domain-containing protein [Balneolaceae bacterium]